MSNNIEPIRSAIGKEPDMVLVELVISKEVAITLSACIAEGIQRGPEHCLPGMPDKNDTACWYQHVPEVLNIGERIMEAAIQLP